MCGIIGYIGTEDPKGILLDGLKRLEYRGYDSAGVAIGQGGKIEVHRAEGRIMKLEKKLSDKHFDGQVGIGHTRWATHGAPIEANAHPHHVGAVTLVHNGIIENYLTHRQTILSMGRTIQSETDSEIVAHLIDIQIQQGKALSEAVLSVLPTLKGSYAFVILSQTQPDVLIGVRNGAPLLVGLGEDEHYLASDVQAILSRTNEVVYLRDRQVAICMKDSIKITDEKGQPISPKINKIHWTPDQMDKLGYKHYMLKEIHEQSMALTNTIDGHVDQSKGILCSSELMENEQLLKSARRIIISACGTARHAGIVGKYLIERFAGLPVEVDFASEYRYREPYLDKNTLSLFISQSGETADTLAALIESKRRGVPTISVCNVRESSLARESDVVLYTNAGPEIGVASTKAFTTQLAVLYIIAIQLGRFRGTLSDDQSAELTQDLVRLPILVDKTLGIESAVETVARELEPYECYFYLGRGIQYPIALEGALKLKEISYLHAQGYPAGELKHGPIALVDRRLVTVAIAPKFRGDEKDSQRVVYEKVMANVHEVKSRGGYILGFGTEGDEEFAALCNRFQGVPMTSWALTPILMSVPIQMLAYHVASLRGTDVDKPRNLAKSVTVE